MSIVVTGAGGLVGSALDATGEVTGLDRATLDITDVGAVERMFEHHRPSAIINAAAQAGVDRADAEPDWTRQVNGAAPAEMAVLAAHHGVRFVHLSTDYVLDRSDLEHLSEDVDPNPQSTYAQTKLEGEQAVIDAGGVVVRLQWVYQPGRRGFFNRALSMMAQGQSVSLVTDQVGCPTPASVLAPALLTIARSGPTGIFHLATAGEATAMEWIAAGAAAAGIPLCAQPVVRAAMPGAYRPARSVLGCTKIRDVWGLQLPDWRVALQTVMPASDRLWTGAGS